MRFNALSIVVVCLLAQLCPAADQGETIRRFDFADCPAGEIPQGWSLRQGGDRGQVGVHEIGYAEGWKSIRVSAAKACYLEYSLPVKPGETYRVEAFCRQVGLGSSTIQINWHMANGRLYNYDGLNSSRFRPFDKRWNRAFLVAVVPRNVVNMKLVLCVENQKINTDTVWFSGISIVKPTSELYAPAPDQPAPLVEVDLDSGDYNLFTSNLETLHTLRMACVNHSDNVMDEPIAEWVTPASAPRYAKFLRDSGFNAVLTNGQRYLMSDSKDHKPYPDVLKGSLPFPELVENAAAFVKAFHDEGLKVYLHLTACAAPMEMREKRPDWMTVCVTDGRTKTIWGLQWLCFNNPEFRKEYLRRLGVLVEQSKCDGLMVDETSLMYETCGCGHCRDKFKRDTGITMPPEGQAWYRDLSNAVYRRYLQWRLKQYMDFNTEILANLRKHRPDGVLLSYYAVPHIPTAWVDHGISNELSATVGSTHGLETIVNYDKYWTLYIANMKLIRSAAEHGIASIFATRSDHSYNQMYYRWLLDLTQVSHRYWHWYVPEAMKRARVPLLHWETKNKNLLAGMYGGADTAVVISTRNNNLHRRPLGSINLQNSYFAVGETLTAASIPWKAVGDLDLDKPLTGKCKTLVALNLSLMSDAQAQNIRQFVADGGTLIAALDTSLYDEHGDRRRNFALADVLGCDFAAIVEQDGLLTINQPQRFLGGITGEFSSYEASVRVKPRYDGKVWGTINVDGRSMPGVVHNKFGKGQAVYFAGHVEPLIYFNELHAITVTPRPEGQSRDMAMVNLFTNLVKNTAEDRVQIDNLPACVVVETYRHDYNDKQGFMVCLFNGTGFFTEGRPQKESISYPDIRSQLPDKDKPIVIRLADSTATRVFAVSPDFRGRTELEMQRTDAGVSVKLPTFGNLIMIYFE